VGEFEESTSQTVAALSLTLLFIANLGSAWPLPRTEQVSLAIAIALSAILFGVLIWDSWRERFRFLTNPWLASLLLLGSPWLSREVLPGRPPFAKAGLYLLLFAAVIASAIRFRRNSEGLERRSWWPIVGMGGLLLLVTAAIPNTRAASNVSLPSSRQPAKCNVLLITMDTVRADHLSIYGYQRDTTPYLRDFARRATVYRRMIATADYTLPTHASIFTGLYPSWHGAYATPTEYPDGRPLGSNRVTLAKVLESNGYRTSAVVANYGFLHRSFGLDQGFDAYLSPMPALSDSRSYLRELFGRFLALAGMSGVYQDSVRASDINRRAFAFLEDAKSGHPFLLFLNYMDAHSPYTPPSPFDKRFPGKNRYYLPPRYKELKQMERLDVAERNHLISQYDGGIAYLDKEIGSLLNRLRDLGLYENTLIVITADHGEAFGEKNQFSHGNGRLDQANVHVPLIVKYPGQDRAEQSDALASEIDLMPTVLDIAGIAPPSGLQGRTLRHPRNDSDAVYAEGRATRSLDRIPMRYRGIHSAVFLGPWKLTTWTGGPPALFNLASDPGEEHNSYTGSDPRALELSQRLAKWTAAAPVHFDGTGVPSAIKNERLKSLGYIQ
jgi:arylsulfatase A-like enzyme